MVSTMKSDQLQIRKQQAGAYAFMMTTTSVTLPFMVPCSSTWGPPSHLPLAEFFSCVLKNTSCASTASLSICARLVGVGSDDLRQTGSASRVQDCPAYANGFSKSAAHALLYRKLRVRLVRGNSVLSSLPVAVASTGRHGQFAHVDSPVFVAFQSCSADIGHLTLVRFAILC